MLPSINILFQVFTPHFARFGYVGWLTPDLYCFLTMGKSKESLTNFADWYRTNSEFIITLSRQYFGSHQDGMKRESGDLRPEIMYVSEIPELSPQL